MRFLALCNFRTRDPANQRHQGIQPQNPTKSSVASGASLDEILEEPLTKINKKTRKQCNKFVLRQILLRIQACDTNMS